MAYTVGFPRRRKVNIKYTGRTRKMRVPKTDKYGRRYKKRKNTLSPYARLKGTIGMPHFTYQRCFDGPPKLLSTATHQAPGFWCDSLHQEVDQIPGITNLLNIYRFYKVNKVIIQYTPCSRSDEYSKVFYVPSGLTPTQPYMAKGGALEIRQLAYDGFLAHPTTWQQCLNRAGVARRCATTAPFTRTCYPRINQVIQDLAGTDTQRSIRSPWLSTDVSSNLSLAHYIGYDCYHTLNDISYDVDQPLRINRRFVVSISFKGIKF